MSFIKRDKVDFVCFAFHWLGGIFILEIYLLITVSCEFHQKRWSSFCVSRISLSGIFILKTCLVITVSCEFHQKGQSNQWIYLLGIIVKFINNMDPKVENPHSRDEVVFVSCISFSYSGTKNYLDTCKLHLQILLLHKSYLLDVLHNASH